MAGVKAPYVAIVQARLGSSRLPLKSLLCLRDLPLIDWVITRLQSSKRLDGLIVAIPDTPLDQVLYEHLARRGIPCLMGSENDVLSRYCLAARETKAKTVIRVCADNPLIWGEAVDRLIDHYERHPCDYAYNHVPRDNRWPDGLGAEILPADLLFGIEKKAFESSQREHCLNYIWDNRHHFRISTFDPEEPWLCRPDLKLDIDRPSDFARLARLPLDPAMDAKSIVALFPAKGENGC
ncbi:MAG: NTP transferase domain-containing protein [Desulfovibrio sp.]|nr:NTP transferase domain-containing protein [Desulfovibrio sp.]